VKGAKNRGTPFLKKPKERDDSEKKCPNVRAKKTRWTKEGFRGGTPPGGTDVHSEKECEPSRKGGAIALWGEKRAIEGEEKERACRLPREGGPFAARNISGRRKERGKNTAPSERGT